MSEVPEYVDRILDAYLAGELLDLRGVEVPAPVQAQIDEAFGRQSVPTALRGLERGLSPSRGYVGPEDPPVFCDCCGKFCHYWELHHLDPVGWGGSDSRALADRQVVWVRIDGDCHAVCHMILDTAKRQNGWPEPWLAGFTTPIPHLQVEVARRGWQRYVHRLAAATQEAT
jgi:hypothetical protein